MQIDWRPRPIKDDGRRAGDWSSGVGECGWVRRGIIVPLRDGEGGRDRLRVQVRGGSGRFLQMGTHRESSRCFEERAIEMRGRQAEPLLLVERHAARWIRRPTPMLSRGRRGPPGAGCII